MWTRTVHVFINGTLKTTDVSSLSVGPDGKIVTTAVSSVATDPPPTKGIRGAIARKLDLPGKNMKLMITNTNYAQKLH